MDIRDQDSFPHESVFPEASGDSPQALRVITAIVLVAGFAMVAAWFALLVLDDRRETPTARAAIPACTSCGVVEQVREAAPLPLQALEGSRAEAAVILLAALGGAPAPGGPQARIFETSVLHDDGSVRVLRDVGAPSWKPGDRVKVLRGRVEPDALPAGRTPTQVPRAARGL